MMDFSFILEVDPRIWHLCEHEFTLQWTLLSRHFMNPHAILPFGFLLSFLTTLSCSVVFLCIIRVDSVIFHTSSMSYLRHKLIWLVVIFVYSCFVLTWLLSLSPSRREIMWRSFVHSTGCCVCGGVGVSGPGVDGV